MAEDYYKTLGVARDASPEDIQKAYRDLARKYHPDLHPDDKTAKKKFQEVQAAFDVLNDQSKRELYDRYGHGFEQMGAGGPRGGYGYGGASPGGGYPGGGASFEDFDFSQIFGDSAAGGGGGFGDIFGQFRRGGKGRGGRKAKPAPDRGYDLRSEVEIPLRTAVQGGEVELSVERPGGKQESIRVRVPAGIADGAKMRLRGQGGEGTGGGPNGDILLTVKVAPHPLFQRRGDNLDIKVPISLREAVLGAKVDIPTPKGRISIRVPPGVSSGKKLRVKGHGVPNKSGDAGDLFAEVQIVLPASPSEELQKLAETLPADGDSLRNGLEW